MPRALAEALARVRADADVMPPQQLEAAMADAWGPEVREVHEGCGVCTMHELEAAMADAWGPEVREVHGGCGVCTMHELEAAMADAWGPEVREVHGWGYIGNSQLSATSGPSDHRAESQNVILNGCQS